MSNVHKFPTPPRRLQAIAEDYAISEMRANFGACAGLLHGDPSDKDLQEIILLMKAITRQLDGIIGIREACK